MRQMIVRRNCPFCPWFLDDPGPTIKTHPGIVVSEPAATVAQAIQAHVDVVYRLYLAKIERALQDHIDTHVAEMVEEI